MAKRQNEVGTGFLTEFLEVAIHNILRLRSLYPETIFVKEKKYGVAVYRCTHPQLCAYVTDCLKSVHELVKKSALHSVVLVFTNEESKPVERYVFDVLEKNSDRTDNEIFMLEVEERLRACCLKLQTRCSSLKPLSTEHNFAIQIHTTDLGALQLSSNPQLENFPWIEAEECEVTMEDGKLLPIRTIDTHCFKLQMYMIEDESNQ